jgi:hypothetical protein
MYKNENANQTAANYRDVWARDSHAVVGNEPFVRKLEIISELEPQNDRPLNEFPM